MRTTLSISDALLEELRRRAEQTGRPFRVVLEETLHLGLGHASSSRQPKFRVKPHPLHIKSGFRAASMNQLYDQFEAEDSARRK